MGALLEKTKFSGTLRACEEPEPIFYGIAVVIKLSKGSLNYRSVNFGKVLQSEGLNGEGVTALDFQHVGI